MHSCAISAKSIATIFLPPHRSHECSAHSPPSSQAGAPPPPPVRPSPVPPLPILTGSGNQPARQVESGAPSGQGLFFWGLGRACKLPQTGPNGVLPSNPALDVPESIISGVYFRVFVPFVEYPSRDPHRCPPPPGSAGPSPSLSTGVSSADTRRSRGWPRKVPHERRVFVCDGNTTRIPPAGAYRAPNYPCTENLISPRKKETHPQRYPPPHRRSLTPRRGQHPPHRLCVPPPLPLPPGPILKKYRHYSNRENVDMLSVLHTEWPIGTDVPPNTHLTQS